MIASQNHILRAVLMLQLEVGERLTAVPGTKAYGAMTIIMAYHYRIEFRFQVSRDLFVPQPAVESVALRLTPLEKPPVSVSDVTLFKKLVKSAFQHRRKMLRHAVNRLLPGSSDLLEKQTGIDLKRRGETLNLQEFAFLSDALIDCGYSTFQSSVELQAK